jgi:hypothetical protein
MAFEVSAWMVRPASEGKEAHEDTQMRLCPSHGKVTKDHKCEWMPGASAPHAAATPAEPDGEEAARRGKAYQRTFNPTASPASPSLPAPQKKGK